MAAFGRPAAEWLQLSGWPELQAWAAEGRTAAARYTLSLGDAVRPRAECDTAVALLPRPTTSSLAPLAEALDAEAAFTTRPTWGGAPAETGALARLQGDSWFDAAGTAAGTRALGRCGLRFVARLRELALLLSDQADPPGSPSLGSLSLGAGRGLAWVESARGLLLHRVRLESGRVSEYRIVAPTDWNFHPRGALAAALEGACVPDRDSALALATRVVHGLDPCVPCHVEVDDA
jgi:Ni,Fe-hydrogenase I large subunit